jgi:hypothetical protein
MQFLAPSHRGLTTCWIPCIASAANTRVWRRHNPAQTSRAFCSPVPSALYACALSPRSLLLGQGEILYQLRVLWA